MGRPNFDQYAGGVSLPNTENSPGPNNRIVVNNAGIKAWSARTTKLSLEYYFERVGLVAVSVFNRDFTNFFGASVFTPSPQFLDLYGLDSAVYGDYDVQTQQNLDSKVRMTGFDFSYKQALTFLPPWGRGIKVFANANTLRASGEASANFAGFLPLNASWGVSLSRPTYNLRVNWNYSGRQGRTQVAAGRSIEPGTYNWGSKRLIVDINGEYFFHRRFAVYTNLSNIHDAPADTEIAGPSTPAHAQFRQRTQFGAQWTFGIKGSF